MTQNHVRIIVETIDDVIGDISMYSASAILVIGWLLHFWKKYDQKYVPILLLFLASAGCDWLAVILKEEYKNNMPAFHLYGLLHGLILVWFFSMIIRTRKALIQIGSLYLVFYIINSAFLESIFTYNAIAKVTQNAFFIILSFWYFFDVYKYETNLELESSGIFWIVVGILIYHSGALFSSLFSAKILSGNNDRLFSTWVVHNIAGTIKNLLFLLGLWMGRTRLRTK